MAVVIAGIYEIDKKIGAGGGGVVYLGRHIRLDKQIVLKADKRKLSAGTEKLRKEVDLLKSLSHTYIPQVYDFVQEGEIVFTVMDYVEGESLDKLLARGQAVPQKVIVKWACQLLEALSYLHNQKPYGILHGDIKPANIMLRADGDICLIDYNIALALGEDGAVSVGYSRGYASPEHYGSGGSGIDPLAGTGATGTGSASGTGTGSASGIGTGTAGTGSASGSSSSKRKLLLDVRSDIYSLGATLYHLLSGRKPAEKAADVVPLDGCCSPQIAAIIRKAMDPDSGRRYQTAEEMLDAFLHLRTNDQRVVKNRRRFIVSAALSILMLLLGGACTFIGMKQTENYQQALTLVSYSQASLADGDIEAAAGQAMQALEPGEGIFRPPVPAGAQKALTDALGVYELSDGFKEDAVITLPAAPFALEVSPKGTRYAVVYAYEAAVYSAGSREPDAVRKVQEQALSDCLFLDEDTILYAGEQGVEAYDLASGNVLWTGDAASILTLSGDRSVAAAVNGEDDRAVLYRTKDGKKLGECSFPGRHIVTETHIDRENYIFALDDMGEWLAVSFTDGGLSVFDTKDAENDRIIYDDSEYDMFSGGFSGKRFAFAAQRKGTNFFGVIDVEGAEFLGNMESRDNLMVRTDEDGILLSDGNLLARFAADTLEETELAYTEGNTIQDYDAGGRFSMVLTDDHTISFYDRGAECISQISFEEMSNFIKLADGYALAADRKEPQVRVLRLDEHSDAQLFSYDAGYAHSEARVSGDGQALMLFGYEGFQIYDTSGKQTAQCELPDAEHIFDQQYIRGEDASYLEVLWDDGTVRCYGMDGMLLSQKKEEAPDSLEEEFLTNQYRIVSKPHETPQVYDKKSGRHVAGLEKDAQLTYVTQLDGYIMTEYVSSVSTTSVERYGILLDENLQELAYLPGLCDAYGSTVVFDYENGDIRSCSIYSLDELKALGREY